jgi:hypothetical protein
VLEKSVHNPVPIDGGASVDSLMDVPVSERSTQNKYKPLKLSGYKQPNSNNFAT